jgi:conjugal transfer/type IV secretion protein DotA/TraY
MIDLLSKSSEMCKDIAWGWILTLFGTEGSGCTLADIPTAAVSNTPYANAFAVLTAALAFIGSLFLAYHVLSGIVSTAYTGKVLGERWHQIWAPLRVVFGFGLLIPVGGGFSSVHYILRDVVGLAAVNLGNGVIKTYIATAFDPNSSYNRSKIYTLSGDDVVNKFFMMEVCAGVIDNMASSWFTVFPYKAKGDSPDASAPQMVTEGSSGYTWDYGSCGSINLPMASAKASDGVFSTPEVQQYISQFNEKRAAATDALKESLQGTKVTDYKKLGEIIDRNSDSITSSSDAFNRALRESTTISPGIQDKLDAAAAKWDEEVSKAATNIFDEAAKGSRAGALNSIQEKGFLMAGAYERSLSAVSSFVSGIANTTVSLTRKNLDDDVEAKVRFAIAAVNSTKANDNVNGGDLSASASTDTMSKVLKAILPANLENMFYSQPSADPVGDMIMFGNNMLTASVYIILFLVTLKTGGVLASIAGFLVGGPGAAAAAGVTSAVLGSVVSAITPWIAPVLVTMILAGLMHSFVIPMIPFIMVLMMGVSWLLMFLEGMIAAVLWAFIFIRMDGHEFADQKQSPGVALLFNLLLRPALGMLAFAGMILLLPTLLNALNIMWNTAFTLQTGSHAWSLTWLYQIAAQMVIFCWIQWTITMRMASLIPSIADRVGHWMGMSSTNGYNEGGETASIVTGAVAATHAVNRGVQGTISNLGGGNRGGKGKDGGSANSQGHENPTKDAERAAEGARRVPRSFGAK